MGDPDMPCTLDYTPVCCKKTTYDNMCVAQRVLGLDDAEAADKCKTGKCSGHVHNTKAPEPCTLEYAPLCCVDKRGDKVTYDNECVAAQNDCDLSDCTEGECDDEPKWPTEEPCECTKESDPVCCDDVDYANPCLAQCDGFGSPSTDAKCILGSCAEDDPCGCGLAYAPVCCDGRDFASVCDAECAGVDYAEEACLRGVCDESEECACSREYAPVCCDGTSSFNNLCLAECGGLKADVCEAGSCAALGCECQMNIEPVCCDGQSFDNECVAECNGKEKDECEEGGCVESYGAASGYSSFLSMGSTASTSQWNILVIIIQLCVLAVCCLSLGVSISFCLRNPNKLVKNPNYEKAQKQSFGRDQ